MKTRFFTITISVLIVSVFAISAMLATLLDMSGVVLIKYEDGTVMLGEPKKASSARPPFRPFKIPISSNPIQTVPPGEPGEPLTFAEIYSLAAPAVALVVTSSGTSGGGGTGSGIVISGDGYIVTNHHVVSDAAEISVVLYDGLQHTAQLVGSDRLSDLAVLKIRAEELPFVSFGSSDDMRPGDLVSVIGNPLGSDLSNTITTGVISGINRDITIEGTVGDITMTVLQTSCAVNPGNSGGPLLNEYGMVVGIISSKIMGNRTQTAEGLGFAIPSSTAVPLIEQIIEFGYVRGRAALGIVVDTSYLPIYDMPPGVRVIETDRRADVHSKLQPGDIITHVSGEAVSGIADLNAIRNAMTAGESMRLTVWRHGNTLTIDIVLMEEGRLR